MASAFVINGKNSKSHVTDRGFIRPKVPRRYAANLKRELPRIPFAPDFAAFATAGRELARLHVEYESLPSWPLQEIEIKGVPYSQHVVKMKLSPDKLSLHMNDSLTLAGIPPEAFDYRLGSRSALEWVIDQYQVKGESDPNREDDPGYIVRLAGQVVRVSTETARIVKSLPAYR
jgi:predicted helicase